MAAVLIGGYLLLAKPLLDQADKAVRPATHRIDRVTRCIEHANGNPHRLYRCSAKF